MLSTEAGKCSICPCPASERRSPLDLRVGDLSNPWTRGQAITGWGWQAATSTLELWEPLSPAVPHQCQVLPQAISGNVQCVSCCWDGGGGQG